VRVLSLAHHPWIAGTLLIFATKESGCAGIFFRSTVCCKIVCNEIFKYPISGSEKYQNEFPTPKYVGMDTLIIIIE